MPPQSTQPPVNRPDSGGTSLRKDYTLAIGLGVLHALAFAPWPLPGWALPFVQVFVLAAAFVLLQRAPGTRAAALIAFLFAASQFATGLYWLFISMHRYGGLASPLAALGVLILACFLALYPVLATVVARWLTPARGSGSWLMQLRISGVWASCWAFAEWLRGTLLTGFPWLNIGYAHVEGVLAPWAPLVGVYGVAWLAAFAATAIAVLVQHKDTAEDARAAVGVGLTIVIGLLGIWLGHAHWTQPNGSPLIVRLVQGNVPQSEKFDPELLLQGVERYLELAALPAKAPDGQPGLIVLPETVIPVFQDQLAPDLWQRWHDIAVGQNATVIMGAPLRDPVDKRYTNSAIAFDAATPLEDLVRGRAGMRYDKHHLVPFGEFVPAGFRWFVDLMHIPLGDFDRGAVRQRHFAVASQYLAPDICYEDVFGEEIIRQVRDSDTLGPGASMLVNVSNLAWFGDTWALRQHLQISRMRARETGRPMLRATNTGMTAAIDPDGSVRAVLHPMQRGVLDVEVQGMTGLTPYVRYGNGLVLGWIALLLAVAFLSRSNLRKEKI